MDLPQGRATTRLKYRFADFDQARAHVRDFDGRALFFYRDEKLRMLPHSPVCVEFSFDDGVAARLLHGAAMDSLEGSGTWVEIQDTRPVQTKTEFTRTSRRLGCDLQVEVRTGSRIETGRLLDLSEGGGRVHGICGLAPGEAVEVRLLSGDRLTFRDLSFGRVAWAQRKELGVQFDPKDLVGRSAVTKLLLETAAQWRGVWESVHPSSCCAGSGLADPEPPALPSREEVTDKVAL